MPYHQFKDEEGNEYGSFETFHVDDSEVESATEFEPKDPAFTEPGWYWWACFPGCLPDSEPNGPFENEQAAICNAQEEN